MSDLKSTDLESSSIEELQRLLLITQIRAARAQEAAALETTAQAKRVADEQLRRMNEDREIARLEHRRKGRRDAMLEIIKRPERAEFDNIPSFMLDTKNPGPSTWDQVRAFGLKKIDEKYALVSDEEIARIFSSLPASEREPVDGPEA